MNVPPFTRPQGDPAAILSAAARIGNLAGTGQTALTTFNTATANMLKSWSTPIAVQFAQLAGAHTKRLTAAIGQVEGAAGAVKGYGQALQAAQQTIDALTAQWQGQQQTLEGHTPSGEALPGRSTAIQEQGRIESDAAQELARFERIGKGLAATLDESTTILAGNLGGKSPEQLFTQVLGAWNEISPEFKLATTGGKVIGIITKSAGAARAVKTYADANRAETLLRQTRGLALATAGVLIRDGGKYNRIPGQLGILARDIKDAQRVADGAKAVAQSRYLAFYKAIVPASRFSKGLAVAGIVGGGYDLVANPLGETGARRGVSVTMDIVGIGASGTAMAAAAGALTLGPVGVGVVAGALVVTAAWGAGTYVYDHWDGIKQGASTAAHWVGDTTKNAAKSVGKGMKNLAGDVGHAVTGLFSW